MLSAFSVSGVAADELALPVTEPTPVAVATESPLVLTEPVPELSEPPLELPTVTAPEPLAVAEPEPSLAEPMAEQEIPVDQEQTASGMGDISAKNLLAYLETKDYMPSAPVIEGLEVVEIRIHLQGQRFIPDQEPSFAQVVELEGLDLGQDRRLHLQDKSGQLLSQMRRISHGDSLYIYDYQARELAALYKATVSIIMAEVDQPEQPELVVPQPEVPTQPTEPVVEPRPEPELPQVTPQPEPQPEPEPTSVSPVAETPQPSPAGPLDRPAQPARDDQSLAEVRGTQAEDAGRVANQPREDASVAADSTEPQNQSLQEVLAVLPSAFGEQVLESLQAIVADLVPPAQPASPPAERKKRIRHPLKKAVASFDKAGNLLIVLPAGTTEVTLVIRLPDGQTETYQLTKTGEVWSGLPAQVTYDAEQEAMIVDKASLTSGMGLLVHPYQAGQELTPPAHYQLLALPENPSVSLYEDSIMIRPQAEMTEMVVLYTDDRNRLRRLVTHRNHRGHWVSLSPYFVDQHRGTLLIPVEHFKNGSQLITLSSTADQIWSKKYLLTVTYRENGRRIDQISLRPEESEEATPDLRLVVDDEVGHAAAETD